MREPFISYDDGVCSRATNPMSPFARADYICVASCRIVCRSAVLQGAETGYGFMMETDFDAELGVPTQFGVQGHEYVRAQPPSRPPLASIAILDFLSHTPLPLTVKPSPFVRGSRRV